MKWKLALWLVRALMGCRRHAGVLCPGFVRRLAAGGGKGHPVLDEFHPVPVDRSHLLEVEFLDVSAFRWIEVEDDGGKHSGHLQDGRADEYVEGERIEFYDLVPVHGDASASH